MSVGPTATLNLDSTERIATLTLQGRLGGSGTLSATGYTLQGGTVDANLGSGQLNSSGSSRLNGSAAVGSVSVDDGTLVLGGSQQFSALPSVAVAGGATLQFGGGDQTIGSLSGAGNVALGAQTLATGAGGSSVYDGVISGSGGLVKQGGGTFTLGGSNTYTGTTRVAAGTLRLGAAERLADTGALVVDGGATLDLAGNEQVASLTLAGALTGSGRTLTAASYLLDGGTVDAALGAGTLTSRGSSTLNGSAGAGSVTVETGTLTLAGDNRLSALPALTVASGAGLLLGGNQAVGTLAGGGSVALASHQLTTGSGGDSRFGGTLAGSGSLQKVGSSTFTLDGTAAAGTVRVDAGTLALAAADRLADTTAVAVASGATLNLAGNDRIASLALDGTLGGSGTLTAATYALNGGRVDTDLGSGQLTARGSSRINGSSAATVTVADGTLTLGSSNRLADTVAVDVARGATLALDGTDTIGSLALAGTLAGSGTLTAATYALDGGVVQANLGAGALQSRGASSLAGQAAVTSVAVDDGTLTLAGANRLSATPALQVAGGARLALGGDQTLGTLAGSGEVALGSFTLATGSGGSSTFAGVISGSGGLVKQGTSSTFTLTGNNTYAGVTRVAAGTLRIGDGATAGSLSSSRFEIDGVLSFARSDTVQLAQETSGSGSVEQAGSGRLVFSGGNKRHSGSTRVAGGELATEGSGQLSTTSTVEVADGARLTLAGNETVRAIDADGSIALQAAGASLTATESLLMRGAVTSSGGLALAAGQRILASNAGNRFGGALALNAGGRIELTSGTENGNARALTLGALTAAGGGRIDAGATTFAADANITGGRLELVSAAPQGAVSAEEANGGGRQITGLPSAFAADGVAQGTSGRINVASGAGLAITTSNGASVQLLRTGNSFLGELSVVTGAPNVAWTPNSTSVSIGGGPTQNYAVQSRVRIEGSTVNVGGDGIVADVVNIRADRLATVGDSATIVARLPFDATVGTAVSMPAMTLELTPEAFNQSFPFGSAGQGLRVNVGSQAYGGRTLPLNAGYITVLPRNGAQGSTAVLLAGPAVGAYRFFFAGAGVQGEIPVFYNGVLPTTPQVQNSISATLSVSEGARKDRFEEAVRTENVAVRLRGGVIAEVGPAPSATQGTDGIRVPAALHPGGRTPAMRGQLMKSTLTSPARRRWLRWTGTIAALVGARGAFAQAPAAPAEPPTAGFADRQRDYPEGDDLPPIHKNVRDLKAALEKRGFKVTEGLDLTLAQANAAVAGFAAQVRAAPPDTTVFFYFSGHGAQVDAENLLVSAQAAPRPGPRRSCATACG